VRELNELKRMLDAELGIKETRQSITLSIAGLATTLPIPPTLARLAERLGTRSLRSDLVFLRNIYRDMAQAASLGAAYERLTQRTDEADGLSFTEEDLKAKAQYFHAMLLNSGNDEEGSRRMVFGLLRQLTNRPAMEIKRLVEAALFG